jgi:tetratricopeptide (TPR) repeat protein
VAFFDRLRGVVPGATSIEPLAAGSRHLERGRLDEAEGEFRAALATAARPDAASAAHNKLALVALRRGDRARAIAHLVDALGAAPRAPYALVTVGNLLLEDGDVEEAVLHYELALLTDDTYAPAYHNLGVALHRSGRRSEAVRLLRKASRLEGRRRA